MVRKKNHAFNPRKNIALTAKGLESPNKISGIYISKIAAKSENKIKQEDNRYADEEKTKQHITIMKKVIQFEDLQTFFQKYNEMPIQIFLRNFDRTCDSLDITDKKNILLITKLVDGAMKTYIKSPSIRKVSTN
ncbi:hypothetical protein TNCV_3685461 [Trichonephila clavipes]|nr:hypothetical protein TNCV_3685461 [Trichonephila clavipes]